ncbi:MAG: hypothetical protein IH914_10545 [candidate division Zixibacteria bacterium]|nr:hypothetical protein [candidate division Zixibacteria bacterium]
MNHARENRNPVEVSGFGQIATFVIITVSACQPSVAGSGAAGFLIIPVSARAQGMGGAAITLADEDAAFNNPAALGIFHLNRTFSLTSPTLYNGWLPSQAGDISMQYFALGVGKYPFFTLGDESNPLKVSVAVAYTRMRLGYGGFGTLNSPGTISSVRSPHDRAHSLNFGFAIERGVRIGFGFSAQFVKSSLVELLPGSGMSPGSSQGFTSKIGFMVELPLFRSPHSSWDITPVVAHVRTLINGDMNFVSAFVAEPIVQIRKSAVGLLVVHQSRGRQHYSLRLVYERESAGGEIRDTHLNRFGAEAGLYNMIFVRMGKFKDSPVDRNIATYGFGIRLRGFLDLLAGSLGPESAESSKSFGDKLDVRIDFSRYTGNLIETLSGTNFLRLTASF